MRCQAGLTINHKKAKEKQQLVNTVEKNAKKWIVDENNLCMTDNALESKEKNRKAVTLKNLVSTHSKHDDLAL